MKKVLLIALTLIASSSFAQKLGHINSNDLLLAMPERTTIENQIKTHAQELETAIRCNVNRVSIKNSRLSS